MNTAKEILNQYYKGEKFPLNLDILLKNIGILSKDYNFAMAGKIEEEKYIAEIVKHTQEHDLAGRKILKDTTFADKKEK